MKHLISILLILFAKAGIAADYYWPGSCAGTLNQCVASATNGDTIYIQSIDDIDESISINKSVSLIAVEGYSPTFASGRTIVMNMGDNLKIKGLRLNKGYIKIINNNVPFFTTDLSIDIENNVVDDVLGENSGIYVRRENFGTHILNLTINQNQVTALANDSQFNNGIKIENITDKQIVGLIQENKIQSLGDNSAAILIAHSGIYAPFSNLNLVGNQLSFEQFGVNIDNYSDGGEIQTTLLSNVLVGGGIFRGTDVRNGLGFAAYGTFNSPATSRTEAYIQNNTFSNLTTAVFLQANKSHNDIELYNNIIVKLSNVAINHLTANDYSIGDANIIYRDSSYPINHLGYIQGVKDIITGDSIPVGLMDAQFRLLEGSEAIDYGVVLESIPSNMPIIDADGLFRYKTEDYFNRGGGSSIIDVGAYEYGDSAVTTISSDSSNYYEFTALSEFIGIENQDLNNFHVTSNAYIGPVNNHHEAVYNFFGFDWAVFNQDEVGLLPGTTFNLIKIGESSRSFRHVNTIEASTTELNNYSLNIDSNKIVQVTQVWNNDSETEYNNHPIGVRYNESDNKWYIQNLDSSFLFPTTIPVGAEFNVYFQDPSQSAWKHLASLENIIGNRTLIDHRLLNNQPCAQLQVTQEVVSFGEIPFIHYNAEAIAVSYDEGLQRWGIINQSGNDMPVGAKFHILINPNQIEQTDSCPIQSSDVIFANGFE